MLMVCLLFCPTLAIVAHQSLLNLHTQTHKHTHVVISPSCSFTASYLSQLSLFPAVVLQKEQELHWVLFCSRRVNLVWIHSSGLHLYDLYLILLPCGIWVSGFHQPWLRTSGSAPKAPAKHNFMIVLRVFPEQILSKGFWGNVVKTKW